MRKLSEDDLDTYERGLDQIVAGLVANGDVTTAVAENSVAGLRAWAAARRKDLADGGGQKPDFPAVSLAALARVMPHMRRRPLTTEEVEKILNMPLPEDCQWKGQPPSRALRVTDKLGWEPRLTFHGLEKSPKPEYLSAVKCAQPGDSSACDEYGIGPDSPEPNPDACDEFGFGDDDPD